MDILWALLTFLSGLTILGLPLSPSFFPRIGLWPLRLGHRREVRAAQVALIWTLALGSLARRKSPWAWGGAVLAAWFTFVAARFFPRNIFVALDDPTRAHSGLAEEAPVLALELNGEMVAYPLELLVPHHIANDVVGGRPVLVAW